LKFRNIIDDNSTVQGFTMYKSLHDGFTKIYQVLGNLNLS